MTKKILDYVATILCITFLFIIIFHGVNYNKSVVINDYTPQFELSEFPLESVLYLETDSWAGSGVLIRPNLILTAGHITDGADKIYIRTSDLQNTYITSYNLIDFNIDLGIIILEENLNLPTIPFGNYGNLKVGDTVYCIGYPFRTQTDIVTKGIVSNTSIWIDGYFGDIYMLLVDAAAYPGNSGGAVINNNGELIGICVGREENSDNFTIVVPINIIEELIKETVNEAKLTNIH